MYFRRWEEFVLEWSKENGYPHSQGSDLVFENPKTNRHYAYRMYANPREQIRSKMTKDFSDHYTLY